jgi:hypothetical protein
MAAYKWNLIYMKLNIGVSFIKEMKENIGKDNSF